MGSLTRTAIRAPRSPASAPRRVPLGLSDLVNSRAVRVDLFRGQVHIRFPLPRPRYRNPHRFAARVVASPMCLLEGRLALSVDRSRRKGRNLRQLNPGQTVAAAVAETRIRARLCVGASGILVTAQRVPEAGERPAVFYTACSSDCRLREGTVSCRIVPTYQKIDQRLGGSEPCPGTGVRGSRGESLAAVKR